MADVIVTNSGREDFIGRFGGVDYHILAGGSCPMSEAAAIHIFGFGLKDADRISIGLRHGWHVRATENGPVNLDSAAILRRFKDFDVSAAKLTAVPKSAQKQETEEEEDPAPVLAPKSARGR